MTTVSPHALTRSTSILGALHKAKDGLTLHELGAATGMDHTTLYGELREMIDRNQVARKPAAKGNLVRLQGKSGHYRYVLSEDFAKLVVDLG